jgi:hypothetical protein
MTPDQLKQYVDGVIHSRDTLTWICFIAIPIISIGGALLVSYFTEKGKNLATKEDIEHITDKVEAVKSQYAGELEKLRSELASKTHFSKVRYEREVSVFDEIWPKLHDLTTAVLSLRPVMDSALAEGETQESRRRDRITKYADAYRELLRAIDRKRPFYPESVWTELRRLIDLTWSEAIDYRSIDRHRFDDYTKAEANAKAIKEKTDVICEAIRERLAKFD